MFHHDDSDPVHLESLHHRNHRRNLADTQTREKLIHDNDMGSQSEASRQLKAFEIALRKAEASLYGTWASRSKPISSRMSKATVSLSPSLPPTVRIILEEYNGTTKFLIADKE